MLLQLSGVQGGLRNRGNAPLGAHEGAEERAQIGTEDAAAPLLTLVCLHQNSSHFAGKGGNKWVKSIQASAFQLFPSSQLSMLVQA